MVDIIPTIDFNFQKLTKLINEIPSFDVTKDLYAKLDSDTNYEFTIEFKKNPQKLYYFGANHSYKEENPQFDKLRGLVGRFASVDKPVFIVEGGVFKIDDEDELSDVIAKHSETGFILWNCMRTKVPAVSYEMNQTDEIKLLVKAGFSDSEIRLFYFSRKYKQIASNDVYNKDIDKYINAGLKPLKDEGLIHTDDIFTEISKEFKKVEKIEVKINPGIELQKTLQKYANPTDTNVAGYLSKVRDARIVLAATTLWEEGFSPFITYGSSHALRQEQILKKLIKNKYAED